MEQMYMFSAQVSDANLCPPTQMCHCQVAVGAVGVDLSSLDARDWLLNVMMLETQHSHEILFFPTDFLKPAAWYVVIATQLVVTAMHARAVKTKDNGAVTFVGLSSVI